MSKQIRQPDATSNDESARPNVQRATLRKEAMIVESPRPMMGLLVAGCTLVGVIVGFSLGLVARTSCHQHIERIPVAMVAGQAPDVAAGFLGVEIRNDSEWIAARRGEGGVFASGARVTRIIPGTPAQSVGLDAGDLIVRIEGQPVSDINQVRSAIRSYAPGSVIRVGYFRAGHYEAARARLVPATEAP